MLSERFEKNQSKNNIGETEGRVYLKKQDFRNLRIKKIRKGKGVRVNKPILKTKQDSKVGKKYAQKEPDTTS